MCKWKSSEFDIPVFLPRLLTNVYRCAYLGRKYIVLNDWKSRLRHTRHNVLFRNLYENAEGPTLKLFHVKTVPVVKWFCVLGHYTVCSLQYYVKNPLLGSLFNTGKVEEKTCGEGPSLHSMFEDDHHLDDVISRIKGCLNEGFNAAEKYANTFQVNLLLIWRLPLEVLLTND